LTGTPTNANVGSHTVEITATDNGAGSLTATQSFTIAVTNTNDAPDFTSAPVTSVDEDAVYSYTVTTSDVDGDTVTLTASTPAWLSFDPATGALTGTPDNADIGDHAVVLTATDDGVGALSVIQSFSVTVLDDSSLSLAPLASVAIAENTAFTADAPVVSPAAVGGVSYAFALSGNDASAFTVDSTSGVVSMVARDFENPVDSGANNSYAYTLTATNSVGASVSASAVITITDVEPESPEPPQLLSIVAPEDIVITATGRSTSVLLGEPVVSGDSGNAVISVVDNQGAAHATDAASLPSGTTLLIWTATEGEVTASATQRVSIAPLVNLATDITVSETAPIDDPEQGNGRVVSISVELSGAAISYPVQIPYTLSGTASDGDDYSKLETLGRFVIFSGTRASFPITIVEDAVLENDETIVVTLGTPIDGRAALGSNGVQTITITEANLAPELAFKVTQQWGENAVETLTVARDSGLVTVEALLSDANDDSMTFVWNSASSALPGATVDNQRLTFDVADVAANVTLITLGGTLTDDNETPLATTRSVLIRVVESPLFLPVAQIPGEPPVVEVDSDFDGLSDIAEGAADEDGDRIPNFRDNDAANRLMIRDAEPSNDVPAYNEPESDKVANSMQAPVGITLRLGEMAMAQTDDKGDARYMLGLSEVEVAEAIAVREGTDDITMALDADYDYPQDLVDFEMLGKAPGASYQMVIPMNSPLPAGAIYRKYMPLPGAAGQWQDFVENAGNGVSSALGQAGACPEAGSALYTAGLTVGDRCVQLEIEDGGPNDADGMADGVLTDPGGIAVPVRSNVPSAATSVLSIGTSYINNNDQSEALLRVAVANANGDPLSGMTVSLAACEHCGHVQVGAFTDDGNGVYTALVTSDGSAHGGSESLSVTVSNGDAEVDVGPVDFAQIRAWRHIGGCTVGQPGSADGSLPLLLLLSLLLIYRRRAVRRRV
jgi:hypothetical protein